MKVSQKPNTWGRLQNFAGFTLVEMLTVVLIVSIMLTIGAVGIGNLTGGKGVANGVANAESLFEEARLTAVGKGTTARVLVDINDKGDANYLRRMLVVYQELDNSGVPTSNWVLTSRGVALSDGVYFSQTFSKKDQTTGGQLDSMQLTASDTVKKNFAGNYLYYEFNKEGICSTPGASFVIGAGARPLGQDPRVTGSAKRDFSGFVVWRNGRTSAFRSPDHLDLPASISTF